MSVGLRNSMPRFGDGGAGRMYGRLMQDGGPSIAERMARAGVWFRRADNRRVAGVGAIAGSGPS